MLLLALAFLVKIFYVSSVPVETRVILGSSVDIFCPFGRATRNFLLPSKNAEELDIAGGHLFIPEVGPEHNGTFFCSDGRRNVLAKRVVIVYDPGTYTVELLEPRFVLGGPFILECHLRVFKRETQPYVRFLKDGERFEKEDFTNFTVLSNNPLVIRFRLYRDLPVTLSDFGRTVQCEAVTRVAGPCCSRSRKLVIVLHKENILKSWEIVAIAICSILLVIAGFVAVWIFKKKRCRKKYDGDEKEGMALQDSSA